MLMRVRTGLPFLSLLMMAGCGGGGHGGDAGPPSTVYLPMVATPAASGSGSAGLFVITSKSPGDAPIQITTDNTVSLGVQSQYTLSAQGAAKPANPAALVYTTLNSAKGDHVWSLDLSATSTLVPTQLSNLTIPYQTSTNGSAAQPIALCSRSLFLKNLTDPASGVLVLAMPADATTSCSAGTASLKWMLIHSADGPTTDPTPLPALQPDSLLPLYQPDGTLAGIVAIDTSNNLNFYPNETFAHPTLLLASVSSFAPYQEPPAGLPARISANPTYSYLLVSPLNMTSGVSQSVYRIDYSGSLSADLYDSGAISELLADSGNLYFTTLVPSINNTGYIDTVVNRIPGGGALQILGTMGASEYQGNLVGVGGSKVVASIQVGPPVDFLTRLMTFATDTPGMSTEIADSWLGGALVAGGNLFVTTNTLVSGAYSNSTQILDLAGNVLQPEMPASVFISSGTQVVQLRNITGGLFDSDRVGAGQVYIYDPTQPTSPIAGPLKLADGTTFTLPSSATGFLDMQLVTSIVGIGNATQSDNSNLPLTYNLTTGIITPIALPNTNLQLVLN